MCVCICMYVCIYICIYICVYVFGLKKISTFFGHYLGPCNGQKQNTWQSPPKTAVKTLVVKTHISIMIRGNVLGRGIPSMLTEISTKKSITQDCPLPTEYVCMC